MKQSKDQILLLRNMHWGTTIGGAFQRAYIYKKDVSDNLKQNFRKELRIKIEDIEGNYTNVEVTSKAHVKNILSLKEWSMEFKDILKNGKLNFGICQKLLNLHIKGVWCFGFINYPPPHFPVDRIIQERLRLKPIVSWTKIESEAEYMDIIYRALNIAKKYNLNLAELELKVYNNSLEID